MTDNILIENIADDLKNRKQWVAWKSVQAGDKTKKLPINVNDGSAADVNKPDTWGTFGQAYKYHEEADDTSGIGFVFTDDDYFVGIDLDHCRDAETGRFKEEFVKIIEAVGSYTEYSPSGDGVHIIAEGILPANGRKKGNIEFYSSGRFFTVTGHLYAPDLKDIKNRTEQINELYDKIFNGDKTDESLTKTPGKAPGFLDAEDAHIIQKATRAKNGEKFIELWHGNTSGYKTHSEADLALCSHLAYWTNNDAERIDRMFRSSRLFRADKWDEVHSSHGKTYGQMTIDKAIESVADNFSPPAEKIKFQLTDMGNSERLVHHYGDEFRYLNLKKQWFHWDGIRWVQDNKEKITQCAKETVRRIHSEASEESDGEIRKAIAKHALKSESEGRIRAMISLSRSDEKVAISDDALDTDLWVLNCLNGTIDLNTGELMPPDREKLITKLAPVIYDPNATCPLWEEFLWQVMDGNEDMISYLRRAIGYSLTGDTREDCIFIFYGIGANGKSTFNTTLATMLGDYSLQTSAETLLIKQKGAIPNDVARLKGARFVTASEPEKNARLAESRIKQITGSDTISARFLHHEWFEFRPTHKIFLATNHKPVIMGIDEGIWRRIHLVNFGVTIPEHQKDQTLPIKLQQELSGILTWAVMGCLEWQAYSLKPPAEVISATKSYRVEMDIMSDFINDCCVVDESVAGEFSSLYDRYCIWCENSGEKPANPRTFGKRLAERGYKPDKGTGGVRVRMGIDLLQN